MELKSASVNGPRYRLKSSAFETVGSRAENFNEATLMDRFNKRLHQRQDFLHPMYKANAMAQGKTQWSCKT